MTLIRETYLKWAQYLHQYIITQIQEIYFKIDKISDEENVTKNVRKYINIYCYTMKSQFCWLIYYEDKVYFQC